VPALILNLTRRGDAKGIRKGGKEGDGEIGEGELEMEDLKVFVVA
jgi:hypothetical protein